MSVRSCEAITDLLASTDVVQFKHIQTALDHASRATAFRYLKQVPYQRSYNHNGRYYTHKDSARYDRHGLFSCGDIHFSRDGSVSETLKRLVHESVSGLTARELQTLLQVRVQVFLLDAVRHNAVTREKIGGLYVYVHTDSAVRERQLLQRREEVEVRENALAKDLLTDAVIIAVLLTLLHHPEAKAADVVRYLQGHSPPIPMVQVDAVFARYDLASIGKKGRA
jgi:hypothetical protein